MTKIYTWIRHNPCIVFSTILAALMLVFAYGCQSTVISLVHTNRHITRAELVIEVDTFLAAASNRFVDLDRQDLVKDTIFNSVLDLAQGGTPNPIGIVLTIAGILGIGAVGDNIKKRTHINTLKGERQDG